MTDDDTDLQIGVWLGELTRVIVRELDADAEGPILELHGDEDLAAIEVTD